MLGIAIGFSPGDCACVAILNLGPVNVTLTTDEVSSLEEASSRIKLQGARYPNFHEKLVGR